MDVHYGALQGKPNRDHARHAARSQSRNAIAAMVDLARSEPGIPVTGEELDADPWLPNVLNGTVDLSTGSLRSHRREDLCTKLAPVDFDPKALCPTWDAFLARIFDGNTETVGYLQRALGYSLTGRVEEHVLHACWGTGANGKSTLLNAFAALMGDYAQVLASDTLLHRKAGSASNDVAGLKGVRFALVAETPEGARLNEVLIKGLTGGDKVRARALYRDFVEFRPEAKYWIATNRKLKVPADDEGLWRRLRLVPFTETITEGERDANLPDKLLGELPGILAWAVRGCLAWQADGLGRTAVVDVATAAYRTEMDTAALFLEEECAEGPRHVGATELYNAFKQWAEASGQRPITQRVFGAEMANRGFERKRTGDGYRYPGLSLAAVGGMNDQCTNVPCVPVLSNSLENKTLLGELGDLGTHRTPQIQNGGFDRTRSGQKGGVAAPILSNGSGRATSCPNCSRPSVDGAPCWKCGRKRHDANTIPPPRPAILRRL